MWGRVDLEGVSLAWGFDLGFGGWRWFEPLEWKHHAPGLGGMQLLDLGLVLLIRGRQPRSEGVGRGREDGL